MARRVIFTQLQSRVTAFRSNIGIRREFRWLNPLSLEFSGNSANLRIASALFAVMLWGSFFTVIPAIFPTVTHAQVVYSVGVQQMYDDNIFLENGTAIELPVVEPDPTAPSLNTEEFDGKKNDDMITNITLGMSSAFELSPHFKTAAGGQVGFLIFSDYDDQNRVTLDGAVEASTLPSILPEPFTITISDRLSSTNSSQGIAAGTASRQAQQNDASITLTLAPQPIAELTTIDAGLRFNRHDFLGDWLLNDSDDDKLGQNDLEPDGADYYDSSISGSIRHQLNDRTQVSFDNRVSYQVFTGGGTNNLQQNENDQEDRLNYRPSLGSTYIISDQLMANGNVGMDLTHFVDDRRPRLETVVNEDGSTSIVQSTPDSTQTNLFFSAALNYSPAQDAFLRLGFDQSAGTDVNGNRVLVRAVYANANYLLIERLSVGAGGRFSQYTNDDDLSNTSDQYEGSVYLRYSIAPTWAVAAGYNYVRQDGGDSMQRSFYSEQDYESNRLFVSLNTGFVGMLQ